MKKSIFALLLTMAIGMNLLGCGGSTAAPSDQSENEAAEESDTDETDQAAEEVKSGLCSVVVRNGFDFDLTEIYVSPVDSEEKGDNLIETLKASDSQELDISQAAGDKSGTVNLYFMVNDGDTVIFQNVSVNDGDIMNVCYVNDAPVLYMNSIDKVDGAVILSEAHQAEQEQLAKDAESDLYPNKNDKLTKGVSFTSAPDVVVPYSDKMEAFNVTNIDECISFKAINRDKNPYVYYSSIMVRLLPITGFDGAMKSGYAEAEKAMDYIIEKATENFFGNKLLSFQLSEFKDNGTSWECSAVAMFDKSLWPNYSLEDNILGFINVKYVGETGYVVYSSLISDQTYFSAMLGAGLEMVNHTFLPEGYSTAVKTLTKESKTAGTRAVTAATGAAATGAAKTGSTSAYSGDTGDYGTAYYWTDADGDIWYWNGYSDEFYAFGDHYSVDTGTGQVMENNDYGWGYDEYNEWSDPGDTWDYADDGNDYEANDYGWGEDDYNEWSDPGDTWDYEDDGAYYEANDYEEDYSDYSEKITAITAKTTAITAKTTTKKIIKL